MSNIIPETELILNPNRSLHHLKLGGEDFNRQLTDFKYKKTHYKLLLINPLNNKNTLQRKAIVRDLKVTNC